MLEQAKIQVFDTLLNPTGDGMAQVSLTNKSGVCQRIEKGSNIGKATPIDVLDESRIQLNADDATSQVVCTITDTMAADEVNRKAKLKEYLESGATSNEMTMDKQHEILSLLEEYHDVFSNERGETDLVEMSIDTVDATLKKQLARRIPFLVRQEVAKQLAHNVIQPYNSPWASPIVLVQKKDSTLRFCVDYRGFNSVTKLDRFLLPRINDMLDQLGKAQYFTTLDLAAGYWQVRISEASKDKTAFVTARII